MPDTQFVEIRRRLAADPAWQHFVGDGTAWMCPCCGMEVAATPATLPGLLGAIRDHLELACPDWHTGAREVPGATLREQRERAEVRFRLEADPAFRITGSDGSWICPGCLGALPPTTSGDSLFAGVLGHRDTCPTLAAWQLHTVSDIANSVHAIPNRSPATTGANAGTQTETQRELDQARELQLNLMRHPPELAGFRIATFYDACSELSGDFNQFVHLADGRLAFSQGDVSGHGLRAGMLMAMTNKLVDLFANQGLSPSQTVIQIHRAMVADLISGRSFITLTYAVLDPSTRTVHWVRAGHNPSLVWRAASDTVESLTPAGMAVGFPVQELFVKQLTEERTLLHPGDLFIVFTDGITEAMGPGDEQFGDERLAAVIGAHARQGPAAVITAIIAAVTSHLRGRSKQDDLSLIVIGVDL
jgi:hypothetical protein